jgi:hypothetical protein
LKLELIHAQYRIVTGSSRQYNEITYRNSDTIPLNEIGLIFNNAFLRSKQINHMQKSINGQCLDNLAENAAVSKKYINWFLGNQSLTATGRS